ncbi:hypothetical protein [Phycicoccus flavus]|uniref:hypothetical protein n=1 Tax=Phycicoccus flavus TaxID=2502783 RepID=UPI000FEB73C0|nr:hypothetical protein [Phycicoccus flavus]NHA69469.1 hypothetical protein [Phycicoccus flavus]
MTPPTDRRLPLRGESGLASLEFLGIMLVVGTVIAAVAFTVSGQRTATEMTSAFCGITGGQGCGSGGTGGEGSGGTGGGIDGLGAGAAQCVGAPSGAAGPVRGTVPAGGGPGGGDLAVAMMGDGTFRVSGAAPSGAASRTWAGQSLGDASSGLEPFLLGGGSQVWSASSPSALAGLLSADREQSWGDAVVGDGTGAVSAALDSAVGLLGGTEGLPAPTAVYTDTSVQAGLSLNAYDQTVALDAGGEAVGTLTYDDGSTTEYVGVSERTGGTEAASDLVPMLLEVDRDPAGTVLSVRTVTDRDFTPTGPSTPSGSLYVTHLDTRGGGQDQVLSALASAVGSSSLGVPATTSTGSPETFARASTALKSAATANGYVTRQDPAGVVVVDDPNADPVEAGLAQVVRSSPPQAWDGTGWVPRSSGCA